MDNERKSLVSVSDLFGVGKLANSPAATRLVDAITSGVGELFFPWRLRRNSTAQIEAINRIKNALPAEIFAQVDINERAAARITLSHRKEQLNRECIAGLAIEDLSENPPRLDGSDSCEDRIETDWIDYFWEKAGTVSDEDMQGLWARVLTRKAAGQGISLRTLDLLRTLSTEEAQIIEQLSKFRVAIGPDYRFLRRTIGILYSPEISFASDKKEAPDRITVRGNEVIAHGEAPVDFRCRDLIGSPYSHILEPAGIYLDTSRSFSFRLNWSNDPLPIQIGDSHFVISGLPGGGDDGYMQVCFGNGIGFSQIGWELFSFAKSEPSSDYIEILQEKLGQRGLRLKSVDQPFPVR